MESRWGVVADGHRMPRPEDDMRPGLSFANLSSLHCRCIFIHQSGPRARRMKLELVSGPKSSFFFCDWFRGLRVCPLWLRPLIRARNRDANCSNAAHGCTVTAAYASLVYSAVHAVSMKPCSDSTVCRLLWCRASCRWFSVEMSSIVILLSSIVRCPVRRSLHGVEPQMSRGGVPAAARLAARSSPSEASHSAGQMQRRASKLLSSAGRM